MPKTRVMIVEGSAKMRGSLHAILRADPDLDVVGEAAEADQAIELCRERRPNVLVMGTTDPVRSGLAAIEYIMAHFPTPILVLSPSCDPEGSDAMAAGAVEAIERPGDGDPEPAWRQHFLATLKLVARIRVIRHPRGNLRACERQRPPESAPGPESARPVRAAAIGASTGGPAAILTVLKALPPDHRVPILLVLHLGSRLGTLFVEWLQGQVRQPVAFARDGERLDAAAGRVVVAPPDQHLLLRGGRLRLTRDPERHSCRPSVDVLFQSVAHDCGASALGCLLTGMGRDGAQGLLAMRHAGAVTIAQDEATSVVYGMPREAALLGAAGTVLPVDRIGVAIGRHAWSGA